MTNHIVNGDALAFTLPAAKLPGEVIVCRETLMEGDLSGDTLAAFWETRAKYLKLGSHEYETVVLSELEKITAARDGDEYNCWFEYDLFCQVNMWFILSMLHQLPQKIKVFAVYSSQLGAGDPNFWNGFGRATADDLKACFLKRIPLKKADLEFGSQLWQAYRAGDNSLLTKLSKKASAAFPFIEPVIAAHTDQERPERSIITMLDNGITGFTEIFKAFCKTEGIYGFSDARLKIIYDEIMKKRKANAGTR